MGGRLATVTGADPGLTKLHLRTADGREESLRYDQLIVSLGLGLACCRFRGSPSTASASRAWPTRWRCATG